MAKSLKQAYDYWQNQPGNYRAPGLACRRRVGAGEIFQVTGRRPADAGRAGRRPRRALGPAGDAVGSPLSPSPFPRAVRPPR